jgi:hypothetical protein
MKAIVWEGQELDQAAKTANLTTFQVRQALARPHVIAWVKQEREVFRAHVSAQNIHRAKQLRDESGNAMAQLGAMKFIEQIGDEPGAGSVQQRAPGMVIVVMNGTNPTPPLTTPNIINHLDTNALFERVCANRRRPIGVAW